MNRFLTSNNFGRSATTLIYITLTAGLLLGGCSSGAPAGLQKTADALNTQVSEGQTQAAGPLLSTMEPSATPRSLGGEQSSGPSIESAPTPGVVPAIDPTMIAMAMQATQAALAGQPIDPALLTQAAMGGPAGPGGAPGIDPLLQTQIAYATQMALEGKPIDPAMITAGAQTQAAGGGLNSATATAQAAAFGPILAELPQFGVDPNRGHPGWMHPPVTLETQGNDAFTYANDYVQVMARDFVVSADITWNTRYGDSGCGFVLRSDGNKENGSQYIVAITRGASGHLVFTVMADGEVVNVQDVYANGLDPRFEWQNDTTNRLTVVGRGPILSVYTNGTLLGNLDPRKPPSQPRLPDPPTKPRTNDPKVLAAYQKAKAAYDATVARLQSEYRTRVRKLSETNVIFDEGFILMVAATDAGYTRCQFDNAWLWLIDE